MLNYKKSRGTRPGGAVAFILSVGKGLARNLLKGNELFSNILVF